MSLPSSLFARPRPSSLRLSVRILSGPGVRRGHHGVWNTTQDCTHVYTYICVEKHTFSKSQFNGWPRSYFHQLVFSEPGCYLWLLPCSARYLQALPYRLYRRLPELRKSFRPKLEFYQPRVFTDLQVGKRQRIDQKQSQPALVHP